MEQEPEKNRILYHILYVIFRMKGTLITLCVLSFVLILFLTYLKTPTYKATAKVLVRLHPQQQLILFRDLATPTQKFAGASETNNLIQILTSQEMAQETVEKFGLDERLRKKRQQPEEIRDIIKLSILDVILYPITLAQDLGFLEKGSRDFHAKAVEDLMKDAEDIQLEGETNVINLGIWEETAKLSSGIANYMAHRLIEKSTELEQTNARDAYNFTKEQLQAAERTLEDSEDALLKFREEIRIVGVEEQKQSKLNQLQLVERQYMTVSSNLSALQAKLNEFRRKIKLQRQLLSNSPIFVNNPVMTKLINSLDNAEIQLAADLEKFSESSKTIRSLKAGAAESQEKIQNQLKAINQSGSAILQSIHPNLANDYAQMTANLSALEAEKRTLEEQMDTLKAEAFSLSVTETEIERLTRRKETKEMIYRNLLAKYSELGVQQVSQMSGYDLDIIDKAYVPENADPDSPNWILVIPIGFIISVILGFGAVFFVEYWDESFKTAHEIEEQLALPVLCTLPRMKLK